MLSATAPDETQVAPGPALGPARETPPPRRALAPGVTISQDGTATWTIPLSVSVKLGEGLVVAPAESPAAVLPPSARATGGADGTPRQTPAASTAGPGDDREAILTAARRDFRGRADVVGVRLGYVFRNGWITKEPALVVTVRRKHPLSTLREAGITALPDTFHGLPVEVVNPTVEELVAAARGPVAAEAVFGDTDTLAQEILYKPPTGASLRKVTDRMRVIAHVSPDAGWTTLKPFLDGARQRLVIGMYDFGAPHIADAVEAVGRRVDFQKTTLVMQAGESVGSGTKADDLTDNELVKKLRSTLGSRFENAWVKIGRVNGWVASSYHIKVVVRDHTAFWLSSGNLQSSNQPDIDPLNEHPRSPKALSTYNREWHAVVEHAGLAQEYEKFLLQDFRANKDFDPGESAPILALQDLPDLFVPEALLDPVTVERAGAIEYFPPLNLDRTVTVTPLLTPDNYHASAVDLITSAQRELLIQNQTFNAPGQNHQALREIMEAVRERQRRGVAVRVIFRVLLASTARQVLEELQDFGFDADSIRVQKNCHTKGIVVDRRRVMLGSQNLSNDGVSVNRDASLLFDDEEVATYFARIFEHDWQNLARPDIGHEALAVEVASAGDRTPPGMVRLTWKDNMEMA
jgi:hypothetical protein